MKAIFERKSIRKYTNQKIEKDVIEKILAAGMSAPSARDARPWHFIVVQNKETLKNMSKLTPYAKMLEQAAMGMVICADQNHHLNIDYDLQDCAAVTENMIIEAQSLGIGTCWIGGYPNQDRIENMTQYFQLPEHIVPLWMLSFGYPNEDGAVKNKWDDSRIHWEKY